MRMMGGEDAATEKKRVESPGGDEICCMIRICLSRQIAAQEVQGDFNGMEWCCCV